jgi:hypothetical protein
MDHRPDEIALASEGTSKVTKTALEKQVEPMCKGVP